MATPFVSSLFDVANPSPADLSVIRAAQIARIDINADEAQISRRPEEVGMSHQLASVSMYLAAHGFEDDACKGERWFGQPIAWYAPLVQYSTVAEAERALFGGRHPLVARQPVVVTEPMRLAA